MPVDATEVFEEIKKSREQLGAVSNVKQDELVKAEITNEREMWGGAKFRRLPREQMRRDFGLISRVNDTSSGRA